MAAGAAAAALAAGLPAATTAGIPVAVRLVAIAFLVVFVSMVVHVLGVGH
jgi:NhaP-type Na+/H+ or K+/H+ antiporter